MNRQERALNYYNSLFENNEFNFVEFDASSLPETTRRYYMMWVEGLGHTAKLHKPVREETYVFLLDHPIIKYLLHDAVAGSHMWGDKNFENMDNNLALSLLGKGGGLGIDMLKDIYDSMDGADGVE